MKRITLFIEDDVITRWKKVLFFQGLAEENLDDAELVAETVGMDLIEEILDYVENKEKILHLVTEVN